ncbi:hypothetical protein SAMN04489717_3646 [Actinopolymorpha singaporensis]|uniref:Uncharacterized protein n=1 Tax=Actinopolymorpha singaporensis TaxID=117157 RepID=A0A1H1UIH8_9ACTN|nr:hypothetical protein SAMN04489717_3646 [Actinopolymorpha singaporensis]
MAYTLPDNIDRRPVAIDEWMEQAQWSAAVPTSGSG